MPSANPNDLPVSLQEKLGKALVSLTSREQVAKWEAEALASNVPNITRKLGGI